MNALPIPMDMLVDMPADRASDATLPILAAGAPAQSIEAYIRFAHTVPMLTETEEHDLAVQLRDTGDRDAAQKLILSHLRFVIKIARSLSGYGLAMADLIQEGNIGLMKAVKRFDPNLGVRLVTFAVHWIKSEMHDFIIKNWRIVKVATTKAQRKLFFNLRSSKTRLGWFSHEEIQEVAHELRVKPEEVLEMEARMNAHDAAFDAPIEEGDDAPHFAPEHTLISQLPEPEAVIEAREEAQRDHQLQAALGKLTPRDSDIIQSRWLREPKATLHDMAAKYQISAERVRQIETQVLKRLRGEMAQYA